MKNGTRIWSILLICVFLLALAGCGAEEPAVDVPQEPAQDTAQEAEERYFQIDAYTLSGGMLYATCTDGSVVETGSYGLMGYAGDTVADVLAAASITDITPVLEGDSFEGWLLFENVITLDEDGWENYHSELRSGDSIYTTEEMLAMPVPEYDASFVAKWASMPIDSYYADEDYMWEAGVTTGSVILIGNGGLLYFQPSDGSEPYDSRTYTYWMEAGQTLNDVTATDEWDSFLKAEKEGATFAGWAVYTTESVFWSSEAVNEGTTLSFPFDVYEGFEYLVLENASEYSSDLSTEELCALPVDEGYFVAVVNWE